MNRRDFLINSTSALLAAGTVPAFSIESTKRRVLVLVELQGANDGLNTVIPYANDRYYSLRPNIGIVKTDVLDLDGEQGLHPSMIRLRELYERGFVKIFQNVGYENQIQSHFRSIEVWERGGDGNQTGRNGWFVQAAKESSVNQGYDAPGIYLGGTSDIFRGGLGYLGSASFSELSDRQATEFDHSPSKLPSMLRKLSSKRETDLERNAVIAGKLKNSPSLSFRGGNLASQLSKVCQLLVADVRAPVFKVTIGSFDTHADQKNAHSKLLSSLDRAIDQTVSTLESYGLWDEVAILTYSEFGRRVQENGAKGTDHGTAAPHFLISKSLGSGIVGGMPDLERLKNGDLRFKIDYRAMYNYVLRQNFGLTTNPFNQYDLPMT